MTSGGTGSADNCIYKVTHTHIQSALWSPGWSQGPVQDILDVTVHSAMINEFIIIALRQRYYVLV